MVICDADHPDIEEFINWKVKEEQKVASIVAGSKIHEAKLNQIFDAIKTWDGGLEDAVDAHKNGALKNAVRDAKKSLIPETYIKRVLDYAKQGYTAIEFPTTIQTGTQKHMHQYQVRTQITQFELLTRSWTQLRMMKIGI